MTAAEPLDPERLAAINARDARTWWSPTVDALRQAQMDRRALLAEVERLQAQDGVDADYWERRGAEKGWDEGRKDMLSEWADRVNGVAMHPRPNPYRSPQPSPDAA